MFSNKITKEQLVITIHHIGGIGGYGPSAALDRLGDVWWIVYDALEASLATADAMPSGRYSLVNRCLGGTNSRVKFHTTAASSASSMLLPDPAAADYTVMLDDGSARVWGPHTQITESCEVDVRTLDSLVADGEVPPIDFLSIDAQGAELEILRGAEKALRERVTGLVCEIEFAPLYQGQGLFCDSNSVLAGHGFRLCDITSPQYLNTAPLPHELQGKGFFTVGEALFLRNPGTWNGHRGGDGVNEPSLDAVVQTLKLAGVAVAFDQLDYALTLCRRLEQAGLVSLARLAENCDVKYIKLLRDLMRAADETVKRGGPPLEDRSKVSRGAASAGERMSHLGELVRFVFGRIWRKLLGGGAARVNDTAVGKVFYEYGLDTLAFKHAMRSPGQRRARYLYNGAWEHLFR